MRATLRHCILRMLNWLLHAQKGNDVLYLKNGSVIKGTITDQGNGTVKIQTKDGSIFVYSASDIEKRVNKKEAKEDSVEQRMGGVKRRLLVGIDACPTF